MIRSVTKYDARSRPSGVMAGSAGEANEAEAFPPGGAGGGQPPASSAAPFHPPGQAPSFSSDPPILYPISFRAPPILTPAFQRAKRKEEALLFAASSSSSSRPSASPIDRRNADNDSGTPVQADLPRQIEELQKQLAFAVGERDHARAEMDSLKDAVRRVRMDWRPRTPSSPRCSGRTRLEKTQLAARVEELLRLSTGLKEHGREMLGRLEAEEGRRAEVEGEKKALEKEMYEKERRVRALEQELRLGMARSGRIEEVREALIELAGSEASKEVREEVSAKNAQDLLDDYKARTATLSSSLSSAEATVSSLSAQLEEFTSTKQELAEALRLMDELVAAYAGVLKEKEELEKRVEVLGGGRTTRAE
ncbi:hypothetical protein JCM8547_005171 [Rhodosporidiobolus lusitaniae]